VKPRIRILVAEDSATMRAFLVSMLQADPSFEVVGEATDGDEVVELAGTLHPDVITMDVRMPKRDGLDATRAIMRTAPSRVLIVTALDDSVDVELSFRAMADGALELIAKPAPHASHDRWGEALRETITLMAEVPVVRRRRAPSEDTKPALGGARVDILAIAASTGGPPTLAKLLGRLPRTFPVPILLAQHMAVGFGHGLQRWLSHETELQVVIASHGQVTQPGHVYLARDGADLEVHTKGILAVAPPSSLHCPSADRLLSSVARVHGVRAGALVLTGMGDDGAAGIARVVGVGGVALAQDEASSVVYGMPRCARLAGAQEVTLTALPTTLLGLVAPPRS
jgi:two-component system, chemotaxis family, protein-glutamate methylesterase/glutaminase